MIVSIAGVFILWTAFFTVRGFLVARRRKRALKAGGLSEEDVYTAKHVNILQKVVPPSKMPQGKVSTNFSPMMSEIIPDWGQRPERSAELHV